MIKELAIVDLTKFVEFNYWPIREGPDDTYEKVQDDSKEGITHHAVFGKHYLPGKGEVEDWVADTETIQEAMAYCLLLNRAVRGKFENMNQYKEKGTGA